MILAISVLNKIFGSPYILKYKMNISSILMCYTKCSNVNKFALKSVAYVDE